MYLFLFAEAVRRASLRESLCCSGYVVVKVEVDEAGERGGETPGEMGGDACSL